MRPPSERARRVALTGGIATGKSTILERLQARGAPVIDADRLAREVVLPGSPAFDAIVSRFGRGVIATSGGLDRRELGEAVFADAAARLDLEGIIHPEVYARIQAWFAHLDAQGAAFGVADIPLLFETGHETDFDWVVVAACAPATQRARLMKRDRLTEAQADARLAAQWPLERKIDLADEVIWTDGPLADTLDVVDDLYRRLSRAQ